MERPLYHPVFLERETDTRIPLPRGIDFAAFRSFHIEVEMHIFAEIQIRTGTEFPPAAAEILIIGIRSHAIAHAHSHIALEIIEVGRANVYIARFDILAQRNPYGKEIPKSHTILIKSRITILLVVGN